jgi:hypothetical protein
MPPKPERPSVIRWEASNGDPDLADPAYPPKNGFPFPPEVILGGFLGDKLFLDPANAYVDYELTEVDVTLKWSGYLLVRSDKDVIPEGTFTLKLEDGRAGQLRIDALTPDDSGKVRAMFVSDGSLVVRPAGNDGFP